MVGLMTPAKCLANGRILLVNSWSTHFKLKKLGFRRSNLLVFCGNLISPTVSGRFLHTPFAALVAGMGLKAGLRDPFPMSKNDPLRSNSKCSTYVRFVLGLRTERRQCLGLDVEADMTSFGYFCSIVDLILTFKPGRSHRCGLSNSAFTAIVPSVGSTIGALARSLPLCS